MTDKRQARLTYLAKVRSAMVKLRTDTEKGLRELPGLSEAELSKLVASVDKRHVKMLKKIDGQIAREQKVAA